MIVQDSTGTVVGAISYVTVQELKAYALVRDIELPNNIEPLLIKAMDYIELLDFESQPLTKEQETQFPRVGIGIPKTIKKAQVLLAIEAIDKDLTQTIDNNETFVTKERVEGAVTVEYAKLHNNDNAERYKFPIIDKLLAPFIKSTSYSSSYGNVRVNRG